MSLFLDANELRRLGMSETNIRTFQALANFVNLQTALETAQSDINAAADSIAELVANDIALDARIDALGPFVRENQAVPPSYTAYVGQTVSAAYVQAEAQATDDAVKALSAAYNGLVSALQTANVLT